MRDYFLAASSGNVRIHRAAKAQYRCLFCRAKTELGALYVALRGVTDDRTPCTMYFHLACLGACLGLTENYEELVTADGWDDDEIRASTPDFYEVAQFVSDYDAHRAECKARLMASKVQL